MTDEQIRESIRNGRPFFAADHRHELYARYLWFGPVFKWTWNQMVPMPIQDEDLIWWLQSRDEDSENTTPTD